MKLWYIHVQESQTEQYYIAVRANTKEEAKAKAIAKGHKGHHWNNEPFELLEVM